MVRVIVRWCQGAGAEDSGETEGTEPGGDSGDTKATRGSKAAGTPFFLSLVVGAAVEKRGAQVWSSETFGGAGEGGEGVGNMTEGHVHLCRTPP